MSAIYAIDLLGTLVFAISGVLAAVERKFDIVGAFVLGLVTAIGGGTLRDILIGSTPVGWMLNPHYLTVIAAAVPFCFFFKKYIIKFRKGIFIFDTVGIALFTILGINKCLEVGLPEHIALMMGIVSAVFGGIIRDVLSNEVPLIFRKEIYATACLIGGLAYLLLLRFTSAPHFLIIVPIAIVIIIRYYSVKRDWQVPFNPL